MNDEQKLTLGTIRSNVDVTNQRDLVMLSDAVVRKFGDYMSDSLKAEFDSIKADLPDLELVMARLTNKLEIHLYDTGKLPPYTYIGYSFGSVPNYGLYVNHDELAEDVALDVVVELPTLHDVEGYAAANPDETTHIFVSAGNGDNHLYHINGGQLTELWSIAWRPV